MYLLVFLLAINIFKIFVAPYFPLIGDEAYYWLWSRHLDLSYVDHPPMIAYVNYALTVLFGNSEFAIRLCAILIVFLVSIIIYLTGKELSGQRAGALAAISFNLIPTFFGGGMFLVPQMLLFLFWSLSFYLFVIIVRSGKPNYWYLLGISCGLGLLSDYVMGLFFFAAALFLLINKGQRIWFTRKEPYLALLISIILFLPVIIWNLRLEFTPIHYWGGKMGLTPRIGDNLLNFFGLQMLLYTPPIFFITLYLIFRKGWRNSLFKLFSGIVFLPFLIISPIMNVGGHWPAASYLPAILDLHRVKKITAGIFLFFAIIMNVLGFTYYMYLYPTPKELKGKELTINAELPAFLAANRPDYIFANDLGILGLVSFHGRHEVHMAPGRLRQVDLWGAPALKKGNKIIYFAINEPTLEHKLKPLFAKIRLEPQKRLFNKDADLPNKLQIFHCEGFKGGLLP